MGYSKKEKTEAGQGGKLGHSNMSHWDETEWLKESSKVSRRLRDKEAVRKIQLNKKVIEFRIEYNAQISKKNK